MLLGSMGDLTPTGGRGQPYILRPWKLGHHDNLLPPYVNVAFTCNFKQVFLTPLQNGWFRMETSPHPLMRDHPFLKANTVCPVVSYSKKLTMIPWGELIPCLCHWSWQQSTLLSSPGPATHTTDLVHSAAGWYCRRKQFRMHCDHWRWSYI